MQRIIRAVNPAMRYVSSFFWQPPPKRNEEYQLVGLESNIAVNSLETITPTATITEVNETVPVQKIIASYAALVFAKENHPRLIAASCLTLLGTGLNFLAPYLLGEVINSLKKEEDKTDETNLLGKITMLMLVYSFAQLVPNFRDQLLVPVAAHNTQQLLTKITEHQLKDKSLNYHIQTPQSDKQYLLQKGFIVADIGRPLLTQVAPTLLEIAIASLLLTRQYGLSVGLGASTMIALYTAFCAKTTKPIIDSREDMIKKGSKAWKAMTQAISRYKTIHDFNKLPETMKELESIVSEAAEAEINMNSIPLKIGMGHIAIPRLGMLVAMLYIGALVQSNQLSISEFMALFGYLNQLASLVPAVGQSMSSVFSSFPDLKYVFNELEKPSEIIDYHPDTKLQLDGPPSIQFDNVTFSYPGKSPTFNQLCLTIQPGQTIALVSESGGGKSTLFNLLYGYYTPTSGAIYINNQNISAVSHVYLKENIGLVGQNPNLFNGTIRDNIKYGAKNSDDITDVQILALANNLNLKSFIDSLENGLNTDVGEDGKALSGGQQQKVAILRGFLKGASIRLLDEVTAALDAGSAISILDGIASLTFNDTTLIITHKLAEIMSVDNIFVLDKGKVAASGTHHELLENCSIYRDLWEQQNPGKNEKTVCNNPPLGSLAKSMNSVVGAKNTVKIYTSNQLLQTNSRQSTSS